METKKVKTSESTIELTSNSATDFRLKNPTGSITLPTQVDYCRVHGAHTAIMHASAITPLLSAVRRYCMFCFIEKLDQIGVEQMSILQGSLTVVNSAVANPTIAEEGQKE